MKINDDYILKTFWSGKILNFNKKEFNNEVKEYLINRFSNFSSFKETIYRIKFNIINKPVCVYCGNPVKFIGKPYYIYETFCSKECKHNSGLIRKHMKQTKLEKYGNENYVNPNKAKQTKLERYGDENYNNIEKIKQTCLEKYGHINFGCGDKAKQKAKQTKLERYGNENYNNHEKYKQTCLNKYGVDEILKLNSIKEKIQQTCLNKYGNISPMKCPEIIQKINWDSAIKKQIQSKKENGTLNSSKQEDESYELLKEKYPDVIRQYRSDVYPFNCDFYIPSLDLYIECQYGQFHNFHPYLNNKNDENEVKLLKEKSVKRKKETRKNRSRYDSVIETWVIRDVKKRNIAKQNNLNFIEFWNINELKIWINNYCEN